MAARMTSGGSLWFGIKISVAPFHSSMYLAHFPALPRASFHNPRLAVRRAHCTYDHVSPTRTSSLLQVPPVRQD
jgi:hypothetical protein